MASKETTTPALIYAKVAAVMADIEFIGKGRRNTGQGYNFRGIDDVYNTLHGPLSKAQIFVTNEVLKRETGKVATKSGGEMQHVVLHIRYTLWAADGSSVSTETTGEAMDSGDKAEGKAQSYALKVALMQLFCIPTEEQKDTEYESPERAAVVAPTPAAVDFPESRPTEAQLQQMVQLLASPELDAEERTMLLARPLDARPLSWVESTLEKLPAVVAERRDPKKALAAAQNQLRTAATRHQADMPDEAYKALMLRAQAITATPAQLRAEARAVLAQFQPVAA